MNSTKILMLVSLSAFCANAAVVRTIPGLTNITFWEATSGVTAYNFTPASAVMTTRLNGNLSTTNFDFQGLSNENYDVFYSNADGTFNLDGEYITIEGTYVSSSSSGLNIAEVGLTINGLVQYATTVSSHVGGSVAFNPASVNNIIDGNLGTSTSMGRSAADERMRVTVGFDAPTNQTPEPSSFVLAGIGAVAILFGRKRFNGSR